MQNLLKNAKTVNDARKIINDNLDNIDKKGYPYHMIYKNN